MARAGVRTSPNSFKTHDARGLLYASDPTHANIDSVIKEADRSLAILDPLPDSLNMPDAYRLAGSYYLEKGDLLSHSKRQRGQPGMVSKSASDFAPLHFDRQERARRISRKISKRKHQRSPSSGDPEAYRLLSAVYFRLGDADKSFDAATEAPCSGPADPDVTSRSPGVYLVKGRGDDAAVELMKGMLITSDAGLRQELLDLYRSGLDSKELRSDFGASRTGYQSCLRDRS